MYKFYLCPVPLPDAGGRMGTYSSCKTGARPDPLEAKTPGWRDNICRATTVGPCLIHVQLDKSELCSPDQGLDPVPDTEFCHDTA